MRRGLVALLLVCIASALFLFWAQHEARATTCVPTDGPTETGLRAMSVADDGCGWLRARQGLTLQPWLLVATAGALGVALAWRSRWRVLGLVPALALLVFLLPGSLFALLWRTGCGPVETYFGTCTSYAWLYWPWLALSLASVATVFVAARRGA